MYSADQLTRTRPLAIPAPGADPAETALARLLSGGRLDEAGAAHLFTALIAGALCETAIAAMLVALRLQGESAPVLIGAARALRAADMHFPRPDYLYADSCGTGGDSAGTINISTAAGLVAAAAGLPVAKHGNRSFTSRCGSADVLEALGARLDVDAATSRRALDQAGFCFLFAPDYHPGLRHAGPVRRALKVRTIMNILGPCVNPAEPRVQLLGVPDPALLMPVAETLAALGVERALVVHGAGLDEVALHGGTHAVRIRGKEAQTMLLHPEDAGIAPRPIEAITGGGPEENAARLKALLEGRGDAAEADVVALNAGALLMTAGIADDFPAGVRHAAEVIASGAAARTLAAFVEATRG